MISSTPKLSSKLNLDGKLVNAKSKGKKLGRPATTEAVIPEIFFRYYVRYKNNEINKKELSRLTALSYPTIFKYLKIIENKN